MELIKKEVNLLINNIEIDIKKIPKEINNIKIKGFYIFIFTLKKSMENLQLPELSTGLNTRNTIILTINELIELTNDIDYILSEIQLNNYTLTIKTINEIYKLRFEYNKLNIELLNALEAINNFNCEVLINHIEQSKSIISNIFKYINDNNINVILFISNKIIKILNIINITDLKKYLILESYKKIEIQDKYINKELVNNEVLLKLLNQVMNISINGELIKILAYFKLFISLILIEEDNSNMKNLYINTLLYISNFSNNININIIYIINEIIGEILLELNDILNDS